MRLSEMRLSELKNPVYGVAGVSVRDPAALWKEGECYLFYTRQVGGWGGPECYDIGLTITRDFQTFSPEIIISPKGYASPGNIVRVGGQWILVVQSYPWPSEIALLFSADLRHWSAPHHIIPADTGPGWEASHGPIDGWLFYDQGFWHCLWVNFRRGSDERAFGCHRTRDWRSWENLTPEAPLISGPAYKDNGGVENCALVREGDTWHFFASVGMNPQHLAHVAGPSLWELPPLAPEAEIFFTAPEGPAEPKSPSSPSPVSPDSRKSGTPEGKTAHQSAGPQRWCASHQSAVFVADFRPWCGKWGMLFHGLPHPEADATLGLAFSDNLWDWTLLPEK